MRLRVAAVFVSANSGGMRRDALCRNLVPCRTASPIEALPRSKAQTISGLFIGFVSYGLFSAQIVSLSARRIHRYKKRFLNKAGEGDFAGFVFCAGKGDSC